MLLTLQPFFFFGHMAFCCNWYLFVLFVLGLLTLYRMEAGKYMHLGKHELAIPPALQALRFAVDIHGPGIVYNKRWFVSVLVSTAPLSLSVSLLL